MLKKIKLWYIYKIKMPLLSWRLGRAIKKGKAKRGRTE